MRVRSGDNSRQIDRTASRAKDLSIYFQYKLRINNNNNSINNPINLTTLNSLRIRLIILSSIILRLCIIRPRIGTQPLAPSFPVTVILAK